MLKQRTYSFVSSFVQQVPDFALDIKQELNIISNITLTECGLVRILILHSLLYHTT